MLLSCVGFMVYHFQIILTSGPLNEEKIISIFLLLLIFCFLSNFDRMIT